MVIRRCMSCLGRGGDMIRAISNSGGGTASVDTLTTTMISNLSTTQAAVLSSSQAAGLSLAAVTGLTSEQIASTKIGMAKVGSPTNTSLQHLLQHFWSTGMIDGGAITDNGDGTFNIAACDFMVRQGTAEDDPLVIYRISAATNIATTANDVNWIYLDYNSGSPQYAVTTSFAAFNGLDKVVVYAIGRTGSHNHIIDLRAVNVDAQRKIRRRDSEWDGFAFQGFWRSYLAASPLTASGLNLLVGAGSYWYFNKNVTHAAFDTTVAGTADENIFTYWYNRTGTWTSVIEQKAINATQYDNAGTLATMNNNKWRKDWVYVVPDSSHSHLVVVLGNAEYTTQAEAEAGPKPSSLPPQFAEMAVLVGWLTIQKSASTVTISQAGASAISGGAVTDHGALAGLGDNDHPQYQTTTAAATLTTTQIASLTSTTIDALTNDALKGLFSGSVEPVTLNTANLSSLAVSSLTSEQIKYYSGAHDAGCSAMIWNLTGGSLSAGEVRTAVMMVDNTASANIAKVTGVQLDGATTGLSVLTADGSYPTTSSGKIAEYHASIVCTAANTYKALLSLTEKKAV